MLRALNRNNHQARLPIYILLQTLSKQNHQARASEAQPTALVDVQSLNQASDTQPTAPARHNH